LISAFVQFAFRRFKNRDLKTAQTNSLRYFFIGTRLRASASGIPVSSKRRAAAVALQTPPAAVSPDLPDA